MSKDISILIPSVRPNEIEKTIREFEKTNSNVNYEIVVISLFPIQGEKIRWLKEETTLGSVFATQKGYECSLGEFICYWNDHCLPTKNCLKTMLNFMQNRKIPFLGSFKMIYLDGREIGPFGCFDKLYSCYGCISKESLKKLNNILFDTRYKFSWSDIDLSLRVWEEEGKVEICKESMVIPNSLEDEIYKNHRKTFNDDFNLFLDIWYGKLGKNIIRPTDPGTISHKL